MRAIALDPGVAIGWARDDGETATPWEAGYAVAGVKVRG